MVEGGGQEGDRDLALRHLVTQLSEFNFAARSDSTKLASRLQEPLNPNHLVPFDPRSPLTDQPLWRYEGSLTTELDKPNVGYVSWVVLQSKLRVTDATLDLWKAIKHESKDLQPLNRRYVLFKPRNHDLTRRFSLAFCLCDIRPKGYAKAGTIHQKHVDFREVTSVHICTSIDNLGFLP